MAMMPCSVFLFFCDKKKVSVSTCAATCNCVKKAHSAVCCGAYTSPTEGPDGSLESP
jgi:hypothetical protein